MTTEQFTDRLRRAARLIQSADGILIAAGAGMGVDSGLPDFRGKNGFWKAYPALGFKHIRFETIASPTAFRSIPKRAWGFYGHALALFRQTEPHNGFSLLKKWGERVPHGYGVFTSNVDEHFQKAGFDQSKINECHGSIFQLQCATPCIDDTWRADQFIPELDIENCLLQNSLPLCIHCAGVARPNTLMFNDFSWLDAKQAESAAKQEAWLAATKNLLIIEIGAGIAIPTVRIFCEKAIKKYGGKLIRINLTHAKVPRNIDIGLPLGALEALQAIDNILNEE